MSVRQAPHAPPALALFALCLCALCVATAAFPSTAHAEERGAEGGPRYPRSVVRRGPAPLPERLAALPELLRDPRPERPTSPPGEQAWERADGEARAAARAIADRRAAEDGRREYYRAGFHRGLRAAIETPAAGAWEVEEGRRLALGDPEARRAGADAGEGVADELSRSAAAERVAQQFHDLSHEPRFLPFPVAPSYAPRPPSLATPSLEETFADFPWSGFTELGRRHALYLAGWSYDPWSLAQCADPAEFVSRDWAGASAAFEAWRNGRAHRSRYVDLDGAGRTRFRDVFDAAFAERIGELFPLQLETSFEAGLTDGWAYGSFVRQEWDFRRGYLAGWLEAWSDAASRVFDRAYPARYAFWYADSFTGWSERPHPEVVSIALRDADDDGVFEPGERIVVDYELINYGGAAGRVPVRLAGARLEPSASGRVELPARGRPEAGQRIEATIDARAPLGETSLSLAVGDDATDLPFRIAHPLHFIESSLRTERDNLAGRVSLSIDVENQSRLPLAGSVELTLDGGRGTAPAQPLPRVGPGRRAPVSFDLSGLDPLELIAGRVELGLAVHAEGIEQHAVRYRLPDTVRDLASRDLPLLLARQARDRSTSEARIVAARGLLLERLREDWRAAASGRGNPYKKDYKRRGTRTALGDLVQLYRRESAAAARPEVFEGLSDEIVELSELLPGAHPLLRKYMRRLAEELP